jgi:hypothetical protein
MCMHLSATRCWEQCVLYCRGRGHGVVWWDDAACLAAACTVGSSNRLCGRTAALLLLCAAGNPSPLGGCCSSHGP